MLNSTSLILTVFSLRFVGYSAEEWPGRRFCQSLGSPYIRVFHKIRRCWYRKKNDFWIEHTLGHSPVKLRINMVCFKLAIEGYGKM
ncbi:hypothetical protein BKA56DRAFT_605107 [Ilyonectria sp. MPI-CAGE-AT-0026]|nr:hypothetical protein BKA56DRAFT_605107 [Ilyonectria sp. MPI-CAGE-AT-0026]